MGQFRDLPTELLLIILHKLHLVWDLYACASINSRMYAIANPLLWRNIHLQHQAAGLGFLYCIVRSRQHCSGQWIRHVHLQDFHWTDDSLMVLMRRAPHVASLILDNGSRITDKSMQHISQRWPRLRLLQLAFSGITNTSYKALGQLGELRHLELWNCPGLSPTTFADYFVNSRLEYLKLATWVDEDEPLEPYAITSTTLDLSVLRSLAGLQIHGSPFGALVKAGAGCWSRLTSVCLEACFDMTDEDAIPLIRCLPGGLIHLAIKDADMTNLSLMTIADCLPNLETLDVSSNLYLTSCGIRWLVCHCPQLALVSLAYCHMKMHDFPEAGLPCIGTFVVLDGATFPALDHLDRTAINLIRRGAELGMDDLTDEEGYESGDDEKI